MEAQQEKKRSAVEPDEIIAHLRVLAAFHKLKLDVQARAPHNPTGLWTAFLGYAVEKFSAWIINVLEKEGGGRDNHRRDEQLREEEYPTLDVAMVWHAYILNPLEYHKDCQKQTLGLGRIKAFPVKRIAALIETLGLEPRFPVPAFGSHNARPSPQFSIDLVAAVKRQASFIAQVAAVGWTQNPKGMQAVASSAIDKYHCFLKKLWENQEALAVPTLEIDLAWHTHQLKVETYRRDSMMLFGRILQHDDDIPSPELNKAFKRNSYDWKNLFHMDYSSGSICTGFRPVPLAMSGASSGKQSSNRDSINGSEMSLQEYYNSISEKRLSSGGTSTKSVTPPPSSGSDAASSSVPSVNSHLSGYRPSSSHGHGQSPRPSNDSTTTLSPINNIPIPAFPDSRTSSTSDVSSIFAYAPPKSKGWSEARGTFDKPPQALPPRVPNLPSGKRPSSAGNPNPIRPPVKRVKHHLSNSTGTLYAPEMPSPLRQQPEISSESLEAKSESSHSHGREPQLRRTPSNMTASTSKSEVTPFSSVTSLAMAAPLTSRTLTSIRQENHYLSPPPATKYRRPATADSVTPARSANFLSSPPAPAPQQKRPSSSGSNAPKKSTPVQPFTAPSHSKRPSSSHSKRPSSSGSTASKKSTSSSLWFFSRSRPATPERFGAPIVETPTPIVSVARKISISDRGTPTPTQKRPSTAPYTYQSHYSKRPSTAPHPAPPMAPIETLQRPSTSGIFKKKNKQEKSSSGKRSWLKFW